MPLRYLPARPSLEHLRNQAKDLLRLHRSGHPSTTERLRKSLPHLARQTRENLPRLSTTLRDAQRVIAAEYGFDSWLRMRNHIERLESTSMFEMVVDHVRSGPLVGSQRVVILKGVDVNMYLPIWTGQPEGDLINMKLQGHEMPRPMTHDLMDSVIGDLGATIIRVVVTELREDTFFASVVLQSNGVGIERDCRPSDASALAVRCGAPIFAEEDMLRRAGLEFDPETGQPISNHRLWDNSSDIKVDILSNPMQSTLNRVWEESRRVGHHRVELSDLLRAMIAESELATELAELGVDVTALQTRLESYAG